MGVSGLGEQVERPQGVPLEGVLQALREGALKEGPLAEGAVGKAATGRTTTVW